MCRGCYLPKQTRSSGGQNLTTAERLSASSTSKADPIFRGSKLAQSRCGSSEIVTSKADPIFRGSKPVRSAPQCAAARSSSKADPIFRGSKPVASGTKSLIVLFFQSRPDLQGVKTQRLERVIHLGHFQSRPDLQGVKTQANSLEGDRCSFQSRPDLQGVKTPAVSSETPPASALPKQTRSSGGQNREEGPSSPSPEASKPDPILSGQNTHAISSTSRAKPNSDQSPTRHTPSPITQQRTAPGPTASPSVSASKPKTAEQ